MKNQNSTSAKALARQAKFNIHPMKSNFYFTGILFLLIIFFSFFGVVKSSEAAPDINSVSGIVSNGESITIGGSGFGTKTQAAPLIWDNFESGSWSENWSEIENGIEIYDGIGQLNNSDYCLRSDKSLDTAHDIRLNHIMNPGGDKLYVFVKRRYDYDIFPDNHKFLRIWQTNRPASILWNYQVGPYIMRRSVSPQIDPENLIPPIYIPFGSENYPVIGQWQTEEFFMKTETAVGTYDGVMAYRLNNNQHRSWAANRPMFTEENHQFYDIYIDDYSDHPIGGPAGDYIYVDDAYIDDTWARVIVGNNQNYNDCTNLEIQPPISWSENSITVDMNQGSFNSGDTVYIFVIDENGEASDGYPVTLGAEPDTTPPSAPSGLGVE